MPYFDIYVLSDHRDLPTLERYFAHFGDRAAMEHLPEPYDIYVRADERYNQPELELQASTLTEVLHLGAEHPTYGFKFYGHAGIRPDLHGVDVCFTADGKVVFFTALDDAGKGSYAHACQLRDEMMRVTRGRKSFIAYEYPPPYDEAEFDAATLMWHYLADEP